MVFCAMNSVIKLYPKWEYNKFNWVHNNSVSYFNTLKKYKYHSWDCRFRCIAYSYMSNLKLGNGV